jgi:hypothetical protein
MQFNTLPAMSTPLSENLNGPSAGKTRLFPLHLSPIESLFCADDRPAYPMTFTVQFVFTGNVNMPAFEVALLAALARHPLLRSHRKPAKRGLPCWVLSECTMPIVDWGPPNEPLHLPSGEPIDLANEVGLRIWVRVGDGRSTITFQFHHACCDGIGSYRFLGDLLALYGKLTGIDGQAYELAPLEAATLRQRRLRMTELAFRGQRRRLVWRCLQQWFEVYRRRIAPLWPLRQRLTEKQRAEFPGMVVYSFDRDGHDAIRAAAGQLHITVNDFLIAALFQTIHDWNIRRNPWWPGRWLRIMMPTDMRDVQDYSMPAANLVSYTFITRSARASQCARALAPGIRDETSLIAQLKRGAMFGDAVAGAMTYRWLLPYLVSGERCLATAVLSNVGDPTKRFIAKLPRSAGRIVAGNLILEDIVGVPPLRPKTNVTICAMTYRRRLTICMRCSPHFFTIEDTRQLNEWYIQRVQGLAAEQGTQMIRQSRLPQTSRPS